MDANKDDDATLVRRCLAGDPRAWEALVEAHRPGMIALARRILPDADAEDVVASALAELWERGRLAAYEGRSSLRTWLGAIAINRALNARRAAAARTTIEGAQPPAPLAPPDPPSDRLATVLQDAIRSLPPDARTLVLLYYEQSLSLDRIGELLGMSKSTASRALKTARDEIRRTAERLARERWRVSIASLRDGVDLERLELDLRSACAASGNETRRDVSKVRPDS